MKTKSLLLLAILIPGFAFAAPGIEQQEKPTPAINFWVDLGLGLIREEDAKAKMEPRDADFKSTLDSELNALKGDLYGVRQVTGTQFAEIVAKMDQVTSFSSTSVIGMTKERAYLEVKFHLASNRNYVVIVCAPLGDVPTATINKLQEFLDKGETKNK